MQRVPSLNDGWIFFVLNSLLWVFFNLNQNFLDNLNIDTQFSRINHNPNFISQIFFYFWSFIHNGGDSVTYLMTFLATIFLPYWRSRWGLDIWLLILLSNLSSNLFIGERKRNIYQITYLQTWATYWPQFPKDTVGSSLIIVHIGAKSFWSTICRLWQYSGPCLDFKK